MCLFFIYFCLFILLWRPNFKRNTWTAWLVISLAKIAIGYKLDTNQHCCAMVVKLPLFWVVLTKYEAKEIRIDTSSNLCQTFTLKNYLVLLMNIYYASSIYPRLCAGHRWHNGGKFYPLLPLLWSANFLSITVRTQCSQTPSSEFPRYPFLCLRRCRPNQQVGRLRYPKEFWNLGLCRHPGPQTWHPLPGWQGGSLASKSLLLTSMIFLSRISWASRMVLTHCLYQQKSLGIAWGAAYLQGEAGVRNTLSVRYQNIQRPDAGEHTGTRESNLDARMWGAVYPPERK